MAFPGTYNFNYYRGDTFEFIVRPKDTNGDAFALDGYTGEFTIASGRGSDPEIIQYFSTAVVNAVDNIVTCTINSGVGRNLGPEVSWVYDVQITNEISTYTLLTGNITSTDDITGAVG
jgi:hypothetical protein